ncbi:hypothetical protein ACMDCR_25785 [Labrys okinawensis]|uniref:hypothetical protein n=1 Tax=Labrys okinawensis TaxID=346911 RepID=UPI0039BD0B3C
MSDDQKPPEHVRITAPSTDQARSPMQYLWPMPPAEPRRTLTSADFRNASIDGVIDALGQLEARFPKDDPVREAIVNCRRGVAKHYVAPTGPSSDGLKIVK